MFDHVVSYESAKLGVTLNSDGSNASAAAELEGYRAAQWTAAAFPLLAAILAVLFLRGVGTVGHDRRRIARDSEETITVLHQSLEAAGKKPVASRGDA